jgi:molecular chaperone GrpE
MDEWVEFQANVNLELSKFMEENIRSAVAENSDPLTSDPEISAPDAPALAAVTEERDQLAQAKAELQDRLLRLQAEFDNYRRRAERDRMDFAEYAGMETARALLPIVDDFERALRAATDSGSAGDEFVKGVQLIYNRLTDTLRKQGVEPIDTVAGAKFDPHLHHAVKNVETADAEDGTIVDVYQRGFNFKGKLLRPAMVTVASKA